MFAKLFAQTYTGSMLGAGVEVFAVWPWVLSNCDAKGRVEINPRLLAFTLGTTEAKVDEALAYLMAPDPDSRTPDSDGARLEKVGAFAYQVVNYAKYRAIKSAEDRRAQDRERKRRKRDEVRTEADIPQASASVRTCPQSPPKQKREAEAEAEERGRSNTLGVDKSTPCLTSVRPAEISETAIEAAQYLYDAIESHSPGHLGQLQPAKIAKRLEGWAKHCGYAMRLDGRTIDELKRAIDYAHRSDDHFWRPNLLSGAKLRKHLPKLLIKANAPAKSGTPGARATDEQIEAAAKLWAAVLED